MNNYISFFTESEKKDYSRYILNDLKKIVLPDDFISENKHIKNEWLNYLTKLENCESYHAILEDQKKTINITACNNYTVCPICSSFKRYHIINKIKPIYNAVVKLAKIGRVFLYEATATIKNSSDLSADYQKIRESWTIFTKMGQRRNVSDRSNGEASKILGYSMAIEVTWSEKEFWHVHAHFFLVCSNRLDFSIYDQEKATELYKMYGYGKVPKELLAYCVKKKIKDIPVSKLTEEWYRATKDSFNFFVIPHDITKENSIEKLQELIKYVTKIANLPAEKTFYLWDTLHYKKRVTTAGIFCKSGKKNLEEMLKTYNLLEEYKKESELIKPEIKYEEMTEIKYNDNENDFIVSDYDGIFNLNWYQSKEYKKNLQNRNKIIHSKKNLLKDLNNTYDSTLMENKKYIEKKIEILEETKKRFSKNQNINKYIFSLKSNQASNK